MASEKHVVVFTSEGIVVKEERQTPLSREKKYVTVDELEWDNFPINNLTMEVTGIWPVRGEDDEKLEKLEFEVTQLDRSVDQAEESRTDEFWKEVEQQTGIAYDGEELSLNANDDPEENLETFVEFLFERKHLSQDDLPIESGWNRYLINTEPVHQRGGSMTEPVEVVDGVYVETKYSRDDVCEKIVELVTQEVELGVTETVAAESPVRE